ncbi:MAG: monovalent cation/H+ antiporter subunit A [Chromatiales bacterium]|nr:monovalent cation/H+ antiporter subunit A [Chromatiales bacterium]
MTLGLVVALPFLAALLLLALPRLPARAATLVAGAATGAAGVLVAGLAPAVFGGAVPAVAMPWLPLPGGDLGFRLDGLGLLFAGLVTGIGVLVVVYARYYLAPDEPYARFFAFLLAFTGSMLGVVLADNLIVLAVFWELTGLSSFLLIGYWSHRADARYGARMALTVTGLGGLALLGGLLLLGAMAGSYSLDVVLASGPALQADPRYPAALGLILLGAFTKSAQWPFHFWLPRAMAAPTPVSAFLHSATMVKAGVFLLARLHPALAGTDLWFYTVTGIGLVTLVLGSWRAIFQHDLKGLLAWSTISHLGLITLLFGLSAPMATVAGVFHILNHATFKASLFMAAGVIDHETGSRDMRRLHGLAKHMPVTAVLAIVAALAMAGVPLLNGFLSKEMFFAETLGVTDRAGLNVIVPVLATLAGAFGVAYSARFVHDVFWNGDCVGVPKQPHDPAGFMLAPIALLAAACLAVGMLPNLTVAPLLAVAAGATLQGPPPPYTLALWHGLELPLVMSIAATALGVALYFSLQKLLRLHDRVHLEEYAERAYGAITEGLPRAGRAFTETLAAGRLPDYLAWLVAAGLALAAWPLLRAGVGRGPVSLGPAGYVLPVAWLVGLAATAGVVALHRQRLTALVLAGGVGLVVTLTFGVLSAPDLALTQLLVEVVSIVLLLLALRCLPQTGSREVPDGRHGRDLVLAIAAGVGVAALLFAVLTRPVDSIAGYYLANAVPGAAGSNAVNVIIVDFRGFDTLGEITVLGVAGLLVAALLAGSAQAGGAAVPRRSFLLEPVAAALVPLALTVAAFLFLRGHNAPGGGFIAALVLAIGLLLPYLARDRASVDRQLPDAWAPLTGGGVGIALATGLGSLALAYPFLTSSHAEPVLPLIGVVSLPTAVFFDLGVLLAVTGATLLAVLTLARLQPGTDGAG